MLMLAGPERMDETVRPGIEELRNRPGWTKTTASRLKTAIVLQVGGTIVAASGVVALAATFALRGMVPLPAMVVLYPLAFMLGGGAFSAIGAGIRLRAFARFGLEARNAPGTGDLFRWWLRNQPSTIFENSSPHKGR